MRWLRRAVAVVVGCVIVSAIAGAVAVSAVAAGAVAGTGSADWTTGSTIEVAPDPACAGTITQPPEGWTVVSLQGVYGGNKVQAKQVAFGPQGEVRWLYAGGPERMIWSYDVDPQPNGTLFVTATKPGKTFLYEVDPRTNERLWERTLNMTDTHDADLIDGGEQILLANMRNYNESSGENEDRILIYDRERDEVVWEWHFDDHYPPGVGGDYEDDWTHVNDVDKISEGRYLVSPRNFDQAIVVNRSTGEIDRQLGSNGETDILNQQHNPDYLETVGGEPTMLVADSENDRIVEYTNRGGEWHRTWKIGNESVFQWPRDADRLPNGNTLIVDSRNHRVLEVTPDGEVVWEVYTPGLPYDAERVRFGNGSAGPAMANLVAGGSRQLTGSAGGHENDSTMNACLNAIANASTASAVTTPAERVTVSADLVTATDSPTPTNGTNGTTRSVSSRPTTGTNTDTDDDGTATLVRNAAIGISALVFVLAVWVGLRRAE